MAHADIEKEKEQRQSLRSRWQGEGGWKHLEDPWKTLRQANGPLFDPSFDEQRKNLELELVDAIFSVTGDSFLDNYFSRGLPAISCWIGLVGLRLIDINVGSGLAFRFIQVLIECIWVCSSSQQPEFVTYWKIASKDAFCHSHVLIKRLMLHSRYR